MNKKYKHCTSQLINNKFMARVTNTILHLYHYVKLSASSPLCEIKCVITIM